VNKTPYDMNSGLWPTLKECFFREREFRVIRQEGDRCVSTSLAILAGGKPEHFCDVINTQDPVSWSKSLQASGMQFAYCPTDARKLQFYIPELIELDDLFTLSYYTRTDPDTILKDPNDKGWVCGSHIVVMHRDKILDPATGAVTEAKKHHCNNYHTKRVFRVVPAGYQRSL